MNWTDAAKTIGKIAPGIGAAVGGPAGSAVGGLIATALGVDSTPEAVAQAASDPDAAIKLRQIEQEHEREILSLTLQAETARLSEINKTMRAETETDDAFVRRWRPTFGYMVALSWALQSIAIGWTIVAAPDHAGNVAQSITALTPMWAVALAVLGVNVHNRSKDKQVSAGQNPASFIDMIRKR